MSMSDIIALISAIFAVLSALYTYWSAREANKANNISRLNALFSFRTHYLELMGHEEKLADMLKNTDSGMHAVREKYADIDSKLREVGAEIEKYHSEVVKNEI